MKLVKEFSNFTEAVDWATELLENPSKFINEITGQTSKVPAKEKVTKEVEKPEEKKEPETGVSKLLVDLKEAGIQLADMKPSRYAGVEDTLAWFGVSKIKDLKEEDQPKVLKMFNKMIKADKAGYEELLESLKK
jgi:hypothetical protein